VHQVGKKNITGRRLLSRYNH